MYKLPAFNTAKHTLETAKFLPTSERSQLGRSQSCVVSVSRCPSAMSHLAVVTTFRSLRALSSFVYYSYWTCYAHSGLVRSPFHNPSNSPVSPIHSVTLLTAALAIPADCVPARFRPVRLELSKTALGSTPGLTKLLPAPVAYSEPILGSTFSPALKLTKSANGTSQTIKPKKDAISVNVGVDAAWL